MLDVISALILTATAALIGWFAYASKSGERQAESLADVFRARGVFDEVRALHNPSSMYRAFFRTTRRTSRLPGEGLVHPEGGTECVGLTGRFMSRDMDLVLVLDRGGTSNVKAAILTVKMSGASASALEVWSVHGTLEEKASECSRAWLDHGLRVVGSDYDVLTYLTHELVDELRRARVVLEAGASLDDGSLMIANVPTGRGALSLKDGKIGFTMAFGNRPTFGALIPLVEQWLELVEGIMRATPRPGPNYETLEARARSEDEHIEARWRSVHAFGDRMGTRAHVEALVADHESLPEEVVVALASIGSRVLAIEDPLFDAEVRDALLERGLELGGDLARYAAEEFARVDAWRVLVDESLDAELRARCASRCFFSTTAPREGEARDEALVSALAQGRLGSELNASVFEDLVDAGWVPGHDALATLALRAKTPLARAMIAWIVSRGVVIDDAPALQALRDRGHARHVDVLLQGLKSEAGDRFTGQLSVTDGGNTDGAISQVRAEGSLTMSDESS